MREPSDEPSVEPANSEAEPSAEAEAEAEAEADLATRWPEVLEGLAGRMLRATFNQHLLGSVCTGRDESGRWIVAVRNRGSPAWLESQLSRVVERGVVSTVGPGVSIRFVEAGGDA